MMLLTEYNEIEREEFILKQGIEYRESARH